MAQTTTVKKSWPRRIWWQLRRLLILYLIVVLILSIFQEKLLFPSTWMHPHGPISSLRPVAPTQVITLTTADHQQTAAYFTPAQTLRNELHPHPEACPTLIFCYGNGDWLGSSDWFGQHFSQLGYNVIVPEYLGVGVAEGKSTEAGCYAAAEAAYQWAAHNPRLNPHKLVAMGWSLGSAVACDLASKHPRPKTNDPTLTPGIVGLIMCSPFTSMDEEAQVRYWMVPTSWFLNHHFRSIDKIAALEIPILLIHGTEDNVIPYRMSLALQAAAKKSPHVQHLPIPGASHNDLFGTGDREISQAVQAFQGFIRP